MLSFRHITKRFPGVTALDDVGFDVAAGACHALLGENGAGKSTLGKLLAGIYRPDAGEIVLAGRAVSFHSPRDAAAAGVGIVHQELVFCPNLSVAENLCLHDLPRRGPWLDRRELRRRAEARLAEIGAAVDVSRRIGELPVAQEQLVQIAAAVGLGARVLVFDEPTSSLGREETRRLFELIRRLQARRTTILYVSHRLEEIFELCQSVTVLRDGRHVATRPIGEVDRDELVRLMVGREVTPLRRAHATRGSLRSARVSDPAESPDRRSPVLDQTPPRLRVRGLASPGKFTDVDLDVAPGEIVGLAGLVGAGRTEIAEAIFGLDPLATGEVSIDGQPLVRRSPGDAMRRGLALVPEDRKRHGLVLGMSVRENLSLPLLDRFRGALGWVRRRAEQQLADRCHERLAIRAPSTETPVVSLSGGNQQKIVLAKGIESGGGVLLVDEPTRGVDVGAKREIHELLLRLADDGAAILLISSELPELLALSDRVLVVRAGRIVARFAHDEANPETVLRAMAGLDAGAA
jgi:ABC-type sugar transport system ATPase subunit